MSETSDLAGIPVHSIYHNQRYSTLKIGMCQVFTEEWAVEENIKRTLEAIDIASNQGAEIAVTPECVFQGYPIDETKNKSESIRKRLFSAAESPDGENLKLFKEKAKEKGIYILVSCQAWIDGYNLCSFTLA